MLKFLVLYKKFVFEARRGRAGGAWIEYEKGGYGKCLSKSPYFLNKSTVLLESET